MIVVSVVVAAAPAAAVLGGVVEVCVAEKFFFRMGLIWPTI